MPLITMRPNPVQKARITYKAAKNSAITTRSMIWSSDGFNSPTISGPTQIKVAAKPSSQRRAHPPVRRSNKISMVAKRKTVTAQISATTAMRQTVRLRPRAIPATKPQTTRSICCSASFRLVIAGVVSKSRVPDCDTIKATKPQASAAATADPTATRLAMFETGTAPGRCRPRRRGRERLPLSFASMKEQILSISAFSRWRTKIEA